MITSQTRYSLIAVGCLFLSGVANAQQNEMPPLSERIRDDAGWILALNDLTIVKDDVFRMANDLGGGGFYLSSFLQLKESFGIESAAGTVFYSNTQGGWDFASDFSIADIQKLELEYEFAAVPDSKYRRAKIGQNYPFQFMALTRIKDGVALTNGERMMICSAADEQRATKLFDAPFLAARLDDESQKIIDQSGAIFIEPAAESSIAPGIDELDFAGCSMAERDWAEAFVSVASASDVGLVGLKYHEKNVLEFRARMLVKPEKSFVDLFDLAKVQEVWKPDLGIEPENLAGVLSIQLNAFSSSAGPRVIPRALLSNMGAMDSLEFLQGNMLNMVMELSGDSWNELDAARIALYENEIPAPAGKLSIIGIADAREPEKVIQELRRLSTITSPMNVAEKQDRLEEEIRRLINQLGSTDVSVAERAETRLVLTGKSAVASLDDLSRSTDARMRKRARRTLNRINDGIAGKRAGQMVKDPMFWTTLNPGLELVESVETIDDFVVHQIRVTADPSKTESEVQNAVVAMQDMFGAQWGSISVVQVNNHFVFMIGSDRKLLLSVTRRVAAGTGGLTEHFEGIGNSGKTGPLQIFVEPVRVARLIGRPINRNYDNPENVLSWAILNVGEHSLGVDVLVPTFHITPFLLGF